MTTPCSVVDPDTVPCDTRPVGIPASRAFRLIADHPRMRSKTCSPTASAAFSPPTAAATAALLMDGNTENRQTVSDGKLSAKKFQYRILIQYFSPPEISSPK